MTEAVQTERAHRLALWKQLADLGGPHGVAPRVLRDLGVYAARRASGSTSPGRHS